MLVGALVVNGLIALVHRVLRHRRGGPINDVYGGIGLCLLLLALAGGIAAGAHGLRWAALSYALVFAVVVTPVWVLAVVIPARPEPREYILVGAYWASLVAIAVGTATL